MGEQIGISFVFTSTTNIYDETLQAATSKIKCSTKSKFLAISLLTYALHGSFSHMQWSDIGLSEKNTFFQRWFLFLFGTVLIRTVRIGHQRYVCRSYSVVKVFAYLVIGLQIIPWTTRVMCLWMSNKGLWILCINVMTLFNFAVSCFVSHGLSLHPHSQMPHFRELRKVWIMPAAWEHGHSSLEMADLPQEHGLQCCYLLWGCSHFCISVKPVDFTAEYLEGCILFLHIESFYEN